MPSIRNSPSNNFSGQLTAFDWQTGSQPSGYPGGHPGRHGPWPVSSLRPSRASLASPRQLGCRAAGKAYGEGEFNVELALSTPQQQKLILGDLALSGMDISLPQGW